MEIRNQYFVNFVEYSLNLEDIWEGTCQEIIQENHRITKQRSDLEWSIENRKIEELLVTRLLKLLSNPAKL
mgnify:CR=1 FL=1